MKLTDFPEILTPVYKMDNPNEIIILHEGDYVIKWKDRTFTSKGFLFFQWIPRLSVRFKGKLGDDFSYSWWNPLEGDISIEISLPQYNFTSKGIIYKLREFEDFNIVCQLPPKIIVGDTSKVADIVRFEISNLKNIYGSPVRTENYGHRNRLSFTNSVSEIIIDKSPDFIKLKPELVEVGGYQFLYTGQLKLPNNKKLTYQKSQDILDSFSFYLLFINGRRCFPLFPTGYNNGQKVWAHYSPAFNDPYQGVISWASDEPNNGIELMWNNFSEIWKNIDDRDSLKTILHWYTESNSNSAFNEGSIVLLQNALELLFHWLIVEKYKYVNPNEAESLSASSKINFLLSHFSIRNEIPDDFDALIKYAKQNNIVNGPESFTRIRNHIVHPSSKKRKALKKIESNTKIEALHLGIWYVEMILLKLFEFKGNYINRCNVLKHKDKYENIE